ncbi:DNA recombination protein RmuC, partial [Anaerostipes sp.]|uniref:DNA recombination protein RmuC n=1 Tax=Anaerostipes sp. TaxID=1872530 RepID=UPI002583DAAD
LFTWEGMFPQEVLDDFEKETGVKVVYSNFDTDETMLEKLSMAKGGDYDIVIADDYILETAIQEGLAEKLDKDSLENIGNINPLYQGQFYDPDDEYTVPYGAGIPLIVYDPEQVDIDIKGYKDLWDPSLEDSIALTANYRVLNGITQLSMGESMNEEDVDVIKKTGEKLLELAPNVRLIQDDNTQNALLNGEASVAFLYTSQVTAALAENPDLKVVYPEEGLGFGIMGMFIPSEAIYLYLCDECADLYDYAHNKKVLMTSPSTLMGVVFTLINITKDFNRSENIKEIEQRIIKLKEDTNRLDERYDRVMKNLGTLEKSLKDLAISKDKISKTINQAYDGAIEEE